MSGSSQQEEEQAEKLAAWCERMAVRADKRAPVIVDPEAMLTAEEADAIIHGKFYREIASLLRSSAQPSQPVPDPVHDEAADAPSGPLEWRRIADNVFRLSRWLDSIGRADWGHELRRASGELSRAHDLAQPSQMDVDALAHPRPFNLEGDEWGGTVEGVCAYDIADMNIEWTYCPFCGGRLHRLFGVSPQDGSESR